MKEINDTLSEREAIYGDYSSGVKLREDIMTLIKTEFKNSHGGQEMQLVHQGYIFDIVTKLRRIAVSPDHLDSWHDLQGYARLVEIALSKPPKVSVPSLDERLL